MPLITSLYAPPWLFSNGHIQTILPSLFRRIEGVEYRRERIDTPDGDFLDLDWSQVGSERLAILSHGLEGSTARSYMRGMTRALNQNGWDVLAWNYRGCSGEPNRTLRFYHSGATDDLDIVVRHALATGRYLRLALVGFSLGGNLTLKYLGERGSELDPRIVAGIGFSVPCDLRSSAMQLARRSNAIYMRRFIRTLVEKVRRKKILLPGMIDDAGIESIATFQEFDDRYTAPLHGFRDAEDYWAQCSSRRYLSRISVPTLLVNAKDDPFLSEECFPLREAEESPYLFLEVPRSGGHVGFIGEDERGYNWMESRAVAFLKETEAEK